MKKTILSIACGVVCVAVLSGCGGVLEKNDLKHFEKQNETMKKEMGSFEYEKTITKESLNTKEFYCSNKYTDVVLCVKGTINYNGQELLLNGNTTKDININSFINKNYFDNYAKNAKFIGKTGQISIIDIMDENKILKSITYAGTKIENVTISKRLNADELATINKINKKYIPERIEENSLKYSFYNFSKRDDEKESESYIQFIEVKNDKVIINKRRFNNYHETYQHILITYILKNNIISEIIHNSIDTKYNDNTIIKNETIVSKYSEIGLLSEQNQYKDNVLIKTVKY